MATSKSTTAKKPASKPATKKTTTAVAKKVTGKTATTKKPVAVKKPPAIKKPVAPAKAASRKATTPTAEQRYKMVQDAAYFIAEKNGFKAGSIDYWVAAEIEIEALLSAKKK